MELQPGRNLVDGYPILASLPKWLQWWRPRGEKIYQQSCQAFSYFQNEMLAKIENGTAKHCFGRMVNENRKELGFDDQQAMFIGTTLSQEYLIQGPRLSKLVRTQLEGHSMLS
jgi:hypothetical protein